MTVRLEVPGRAAHGAMRDQVPERALAGGSDLRRYVATGIPTVLHGPGDLRLAHRPRESVAVADLISATRAFALLVLRTAGTG